VIPSPLLFSSITDWVLSELDPQIGVTLEDTFLAFAGYVSPTSETSASNTIS